MTLFHLLWFFSDKSDITEYISWEYNWSHADNNTWQSIQGYSQWLTEAIHLRQVGLKWCLIVLRLPKLERLLLIQFQPSSVAILRQEQTLEQRNIM